MRIPLAAVLVATSMTLVAAEARAAPPWVERRETLPGGNWAFDVGLGLGHVPDRTAAGVNMEMAVGLTEHVELGVRTGLRLFDRQYFDGGASPVANPELRVRWGFLSGGVAEVGLEGRFIAPIEAGTYAGIAPGLPIALHLGDSVRLDTGVWMPFIFGPNHTAVGISVPVDIWIQVTSRVWLGPMTGLASPDISPPFGNSITLVSMGFGVGYQITHYLDFKSMFLFPGLNQDSRYFGVGAGVQIRIE